jgi:hypothetical protein
MSSSPDELIKKCANFLAKWRSFECNPEFDDFVEFAVVASSVTEFLHSKGLSGLHQSANAIEQKVLSFLMLGRMEPCPSPRLLRWSFRLPSSVSEWTNFCRAMLLPLQTGTSQFVYRTTFGTAASPVPSRHELAGSGEVAVHC